jgi:hypothetical protein
MLCATVPVVSTVDRLVFQLEPVKVMNDNDSASPVCVFDSVKYRVTAPAPDG